MLLYTSFCVFLIEKSIRKNKSNSGNDPDLTGINVEQNTTEYYGLTARPNPTNLTDTYTQLNVPRNQVNTEYEEVETHRHMYANTGH